MKTFPISLLMAWFVFLASSPQVSAATLHVPSQYPTIREALEAAVAGDTVLVACGAYAVSHAYMKSGVCLRSETGEPDCVTLGGAPTGIYCIGVDDSALVEGFAFRGFQLRPVVCEDSRLTFANCRFHDNTWAGAVSCLDSAPLFLRCEFSENYTWTDGGALYSENSHPTLVECVFWDNEAEMFGGAIACCYGGCATLDRCTFTDNPYESIFCYQSAVNVRNCTIVRLGCYEPTLGIWLRGGSHAVAENTIIAYGSLAVQCSGGSDEAILSCCDLYGNEGGDWVGCIAGQYGIRGNISEDPLFCDPEAGDLRLHSDSPCAPFTPPNPECDLIGAHPVGCGPTSVVPATWGGIKALFRE